MYMNLLLKTRLAAIPFRGHDRPLTIEQLAVFGNKQLFRWEGFTLPVSLDDAKYARQFNKPLNFERPWKLFKGSFYAQNEGLLIIDDESGKRQCFATDHTTILQRHEVGEKVCVYALAEEGHLPEAKVVAEESVDEMIASYFEAITVKANALKEFLLLIEKEQRVLTSFLTDDGYSQEVFRVIAYLATCVNAGTALESEKNIRHELENFNERNNEVVLVDDLITFLNIDDVKRIFYTDPDDPRASSTWISFLLTWAVLYGKTAWEGETTKAESLLKYWNYRYLTDLAVAISKLCSEEDLKGVVEDLLRLVQDNTVWKEEAERLLFELLLIDSKFEKQAFHRVIDMLFAETINSAQLGAIGALKKSPHIAMIRDYVHNSFVQSFNTGSPRFCYLWTGLWAVDRVELGENPIALAEEYILNEPNTQAALVGMALLSLVCWSRRIGQGMPLRQFKMQRCSTRLKRELYKYLRTPDVRFYRYAVALTEDLILNSLLDAEKLLTKSVAESCLDALENPELKNWAEDLLVLYQGGIPVEVPLALLKQYHADFDKALENKDTEVLLHAFRLCFNCKVWEDDRTAIINAYTKVIDIYARRELEIHFESKGDIHPDNYAMLRLSSRDMLGFFDDHITKTSVDALEVLARDQPEDIVRDYLRAVNFLREDPNAVLELNTATQVADFLVVARMIERKPFAYREQANALREMAQRAKITATDLGSVLILNWMKYILVRYDLAEEALDFYKKHKTVFNRPVMFFSTKAHHGFSRYNFSDWNRFIKCKSRIQENLSFAVDMGCERVVAAFKEAVEKESVPKHIGEKIAELPEIPKRDDFDQKVRVLGQLRDDFPAAAVTKGFNRYYDDRGIVQYVLNHEHVAECEAAINEFGYR